MNQAKEHSLYWNVGPVPGLPTPTVTVTTALPPTTGTTAQEPTTVALTQAPTGAPTLAPGALPTGKSPFQ